jgi:hypothetical protein
MAVQPAPTERCDMLEDTASIHFICVLSAASPAQGAMPLCILTRVLMI